MTEHEDPLEEDILDLEDDDEAQLIGFDEISAEECRLKFEHPISDTFTRASNTASKMYTAPSESHEQFIRNEKRSHDIIGFPDVISELTYNRDDTENTVQRHIFRHASLVSRLEQLKPL